MDAAADLLVGQVAEPAFHLVDPGGAGQGEVEVETGMFDEPVVDRRPLVGGQVVADQVHIELPSPPTGLAQRARIVLLAADGVSNTKTASRVWVSRPTVIGWQARYDTSGIGGLSDRPRSGRPHTLDHTQIVPATLKLPPAKLGVTHWSSRLSAK